MIHRRLIISLICLGAVFTGQAQDPYRFINEVDSLSKLQVNKDTGSSVIVFTGSSSIRMWSDIQDYFPGRLIVNTGFGGSHMSDLLFFLDELVLRYEPDEVFIYEGDNDLASGKKPGRILKDAKKVVTAIQDTRPGTEIVFISPKPSLARWALRTDYQKLNKRLKRYADKEDKIDFIDVWPLMLDEAHEPIKGIFLEDGLHMNKSGYDLWAGEIEKFLK